MPSTTTYNDGVVRQFTLVTVLWGIVGMLVGVFIAAQLIWPALNFDLPFLTYSRLRPLHTNAVIFAFGGCALFATSYYVVQRTCHTNLAFPGLAKFTFWGWQTVILLAAITLPLGITQSKEYAELEWPIDIPDRRCLGGLRHRLPRHNRQTQGQAHLCRQLVLRRVHPDGRGTAHLQQPGESRYR